jgi:hypothetical protein
MVPFTSYSLVALCAITLGHAAFPGAVHKDENPSSLPFDEQEVFSQINAFVTVVQAARATARLGGPFMDPDPDQDKKDLTIPRALHPKTLGCYSGSFEVNPLIDPQYQKGIFSKRGDKFTAMLRLSERGFMASDTTMAVSVKMFGVPGKTIQPNFADADENGTMDFLSFASGGMTYARQREDSAFHANASQVLSTKCFDAAIKDYADPVLRAQAVNGFSPIGRNAQDFFNELFDMLPPNFNTTGFYDFSATGQVAYQFGDPSDPAFKWFWLGPQAQHSCNGNEEKCISVAGFRDATADILPLELALWGHLQQEGDPVEQDDCWKPSTPMLLGKLVMNKKETPTTCEHARFTPWHAPVEHRPLGSVGRTRGPVLRNRHEARGALPCSSLEQCRQNGEKGYSAPSRFWFASGPALGAALKLVPLFFASGDSGMRHDDAHEGVHHEPRALISDHGEDNTTGDLVWRFMKVPFMTLLFVVALSAGALVFGIYRYRKRQQGATEESATLLKDN